jgi:hypothetical protein
MSSAPRTAAVERQKKVAEQQQSEEETIAQIEYRRRVAAIIRQRVINTPDPLNFVWAYGLEQPSSPAAYNSYPPTEPAWAWGERELAYRDSLTHPHSLCRVGCTCERADREPNH